MGGLALDFYTRPGCHLCEEALELLRPLLRRHDVELRVRDVETHPDWERRYGQEVPVGVISGRKVFKYRVDPARMEAAIRARATA